jgi:2-oxo-3-hexenedioate decarboxylase
MALHPDVEAIADELVDLFRTGRERSRLTDEWSHLDLKTAYRVADAVRAKRGARGERWIGRKIGFTNHRMWEVYDVKAPFWGPMYASSVREDEGTLDIAGFPNPKIEPEIVFGLRTAPSAGMREGDLLKCIEWISLGFELVSSIYPAWKFEAPDAVAGFGVHASLVTGRRVPVSPPGDWIKHLEAFRVKLSRDGVVVAEGGGVDVLGSPLSALRHLNDVVNDPAFGPPLAAGEIITTGTLTLAMQVSQDENWVAEVEGLDLPAIAVRTTRSKEAENV